MWNILYKIDWLNIFRNSLQYLLSSGSGDFNEFGVPNSITAIFERIYNDFKPYPAIKLNVFDKTTDEKSQSI